METGITITARQLETVLSRAVKVAPRKSALGILTCVKLGAAAGELVIEATDLELGYRATVPGVPGELACVCVDARALRSAVKPHVRGGWVRLELADGRLIVTSVAGAASLETQDAADYPVLPAAEIGTGDEWRFGRADLTGALARTVFAAAADSARPVLEFVQIARQRDGRIRFVAADGFRMGYAFVPAPDGPEFPDAEGVGVHRRAAAIFADVARGAAGGSVTLGRYAPRLGGSEPVLAIHDARETVLWTGPGSMFPDFTRIIPRGGSNVIVAADAFGAAADQVRAVGAPAMILEFGAAGVDVTGKGDVTRAAARVSADVDDDAAGRRIALAPTFVRDACRASKGAALAIAVPADSMFAVRYDVGDAGDGGVIMPMNVAA